MTEEQRKLERVIVLGVYSDGYISTIAIDHPLNVSVEREMIKNSFDGITKHISGTRLFTLRIDYHD